MSLLIMGSSQLTQAQGPCQVAFSQIDSGNTVYFSAIDSGTFNPLYVWTITDGNNNTTTTLTGANPMFTFSGASAFHYVCVTMTDTVYNCQTSYCDTVMTSGANNPNNCNIFYGYSDSGSTVNFHVVDSNSFNPLYVWTITDGNNNTTTTLTGPTPVHTFSGTSGSHYVCVTMTDTVYNCQSTYCDTIVLGGSTTNCNNTYANYTTVVQGNAVTFYENATGFDPNTVSYIWSFGTVGPITQGTFPAGWNTICLIVSDANCTQTFCDSFYVSPTACNGGSVSITSSYSTNNTVNFTSTITGGNGGYTYNWNFGDGNLQFVANPTHTYGPPYGNYAVVLTVQDSFGCVYTSVDTVSVSAPIVNCTMNEVTLTLNHDNYAGETSWDVVNSSGAVVASGASFSWMNNTTTYETLCLPTGCYTLNIYDSWGDGMCCAYGNGNYSLADTVATLLIGTGNFGSIDSRNFCVGGATNPCGNLNYTTISHVLGANGDVTFSTNTTGSVQPFIYSWLVDGNGVATTANPLVTLTNGVHSYCLVVTDSTGNCTATICDSILITNANTGPQGCAGIVPAMNIVQDSIDPYQLYLQPVLNNVTVGSSFIFYWSFGDNSGAFGNQAAHNYNNYGSYNVCFVAIDSGSGCIINYCDTITLDSTGNFSRFINKPGFRVNTLAPILNTNINTTTIEEIAWKVELYPNPARSLVNLQLNTPTALNGQVSIVNVTGQVVEQQVLDQAAGSSQLQLSVASLPAGVYFVRLETATEQQTLKFIKE
ncbi:MAG: PKD domain-containing protein [Aureispira sp.]